MKTIRRRNISWSLAFVPLLALLAGAGGNPAVKDVKTASGVVMALLPGGSFIMGDKDGQVDEKPPHQVWVDSFYMDKHKVTQENYEKVTGENPSRWKDPKDPVDGVRWSDAVKYCNARSEREGLQPCYNVATWECNFDANGYRLPTEAEWEYACRAGTTTRYFFGDDPAQLAQYAWYKEDASGRARAGGQKLPNPWGLYDMLGDLSEWCHDVYQVDYYRTSPEKNPQGPKTGEKRVVRGGSWNSSADQCRCAYRSNEDPGYVDVCFGYDIYGFRAVRSARPATP